MARRIDIDLNADTKAFENGMGNATKAVDKLEDKLDDGTRSAERFDHGIEGTTKGLESSTQKFRAVNDLAGGLGDTLGISALGPISSYAMGMADIADGLGGLLGPALKSARAAFVSMNATLMANPIFLVIAALAALTIGFVIAYKKSETFRKIVDATFHAVVDGAKSMVRGITNAVTSAAKVLGRIADIITTPYQLAFKAIAHLWNATVGGFSVPSIGFGPFKTPGFSVPNMPELATGGNVAGGQSVLVGERGPEIFTPHLSGSVMRNGTGGGNVTVAINTGASDLDELIRKRVRVLGNGNVQTAFGRA